VGSDARRVRERLLEARVGNKVALGALTPGVTFVFGGEGEPGGDLGRELYDTQPAFREAIEACAAVVKDVLGVPLVQMMYGDGTGRWKDAAQGRVAVFARQWALSRMWRAWGVRPSGVAGEGGGEWIAAVEAGVLGLEAGLRRAAGEAGPAVDWASAGVPRVTRASDLDVRLDLGRADSAEWTQVLETLGALYVRGVEVDWAAFDAPYLRHRLALPTYPFQRQRYWLTPALSQ
jgi:acyl transferase domain-containing protein